MDKKIYTAFKDIPKLGQVLVLMLRKKMKKKTSWKLRKVQYKLKMRKKNFVKPYNKECLKLAFIVTLGSGTMLPPQRVICSRLN
jgi:hypothetical protein